MRHAQGRPTRTLQLGVAAFLVSSVATSAEDLTLTRANLIDGRTHQVRHAMTVIVQGGVITGITDSDSVSGQGRVLDLDGKYLLPGLIDAHVHISSVAQARQALGTGITTARSMGISNFADIGLRELGSNGAVQIPEVLAAGYHVRSHPAEELFLNDPGLGDLFSGVEGVEAYRRITQANLDRGVDWIKTNSTERAGLPETDPRKQMMAEAELRAVVELAATRGIPVASHAHGDEGGYAAVAAGVRSIEHGTYLSQRTLELMKQKGTYLVPTVAVVQDLVDPGGDYDHPALQVRGRHMKPRLMEVVMRAHQLGVPIVAATDTQFNPESTLTLQHEIEMLTVCGLSNLEAIRAATSVAAEMMSIEDRTGSIQVGLEADLIAVDRNPLEDILALQDVLLVVNNGAVVLDRLNFSLD